MKSRIFAHIEMCRPYTMFYIGLVSLGGAMISAAYWDPVRLLGAWLTPTLGWIAGLYGGDYFDRHLDAIAKPHRPIPSGRISPRLAFAIMVVGIVLGLTIALLLNWRSLLLGFVVLVLGVSYSRFLKAKGIIGNLDRGSLTAFTFIFGTLATNELPAWEFFPLAFVFLFHDAGSNLIGALRDIDGDREGNYRTFPVQHGVPMTFKVLLGLWLLWVGIATIYPLVVLSINVQVYFLFLGLAVGLGAIILAYLFRSPLPLDRARPLRAHEIIVFERLILASAFIAGSSTAVIGASMLIPCLLLTWIAQRQLRRRYEFAEEAETAVASERILAFVDEQLWRISQSGKQLRSIARWNRRLRIAVTDLGLIIYLAVNEKSIRRLKAAAFAAATLDIVSIETTSQTFSDIFLTQKSNPRRAYLLGRVRIDGNTRDMLSLNQLFNEFRQTQSLPQTSPIIVEPSADSAALSDPQTLPQVVISDTTLRDGEQMPGCAFTVEEKVNLARRLDRLGVPLLEVGFPVVSTEEQQAIKEIVALELEAMIQVIARPLERDIDAAVSLGVDSIALFIGTSDAHVFNKLRLTRSALLAQVEQAVVYARQSGSQVVFAAEDATRTELSFLQEVYQTAVAAGATAIGIADTAGVSTPVQMTRLVQQVVTAVPVPVAVHCHNDLGLATANSIAGLLAGASGVQCSLLGIGERAGNAPLEEVVMALEVGYKHQTGLDLLQLKPTADYLAAILNMEIPKNKAVLGRNAFIHESGLHTDGIVRDPTTYEPYPPEKIGWQRQFIFGKHSGKNAVRALLQKYNVPYNDSLCDLLLQEVKRSGEAKQPLDEEAILQLATNIQ